MNLDIVPIAFPDACEFVAKHHRHHKPPVGHKFSIGLARGDTIVGCCMIGRPVGRGFDDGWTLEVNRCCVQDDVKNGCSKLYGAARRAAWALGYRRLITYTLPEEGGTSLQAAGWKIVGEVKGRQWTCKSRPRLESTTAQDKLLWEAPQ